MGLFDKFKKKDTKAPDGTYRDSVDTNQKTFTGTSIERDVTQNVAICMNSLNITSMPVLKFFHNDKGIFEGVYQSHMNDPQYEMIRRSYGEDMYFNLLGAHALGVGAYVTLCQDKYKKPVEEFSVQEAFAIKNAIHNTDAYELALNTMGIPLNSSNKKCLDKIILAGMDSYKMSAGSKKFDKENLKSFMQVLYNAGITVILRD